ALLTPPSSPNPPIPTHSSWAARSPAGGPSFLPGLLRLVVFPPDQLVRLVPQPQAVAALAEPREMLLRVPVLPPLHPGVPRRCFVEHAPRFPVLAHLVVGHRQDEPILPLAPPAKPQGLADRLLTLLPLARPVVRRPERVPDRPVVGRVLDRLAGQL